MGRGRTFDHLLAGRKGGVGGKFPVFFPKGRGGIEIGLR